MGFFNNFKKILGVDQESSGNSKSNQSTISKSYLLKDMNLESVFNTDINSVNLALSSVSNEDQLLETIKNKAEEGSVLAQYEL